MPINSESARPATALSMNDSVGAIMCIPIPSIMPSTMMQNMFRIPTIAHELIVVPLVRDALSESGLCVLLIVLFASLNL